MKQPYDPGQVTHPLDVVKQAAGIGGLLPIIQLMIDHKKDHGSDVSRLISQPGYVLVRAQDILSHAH